MHNIKKWKIFVLTIVACVLSNAVVSFSDTIYVDNTLGSDCLSGDYSVANRNCNGTDGNAYRKIQDAIYSMYAGDVILLREGTYRETNDDPNGWNNLIDINIPTEKNGDSWAEGHYNTLASYPGEWAVIDGEGNAPRGRVIGHPGMTWSPTTDLKYWKFERLEITGGCNSPAGGGAGLWIPGGPTIIRYCYFHDNWSPSNAENPAGLTCYRLENSIVELNYFRRNGGNAGDNSQQFIIFTDYHSEQQDGTTDLVDINRAVKGNVIRYNYFDGQGAYTAIKYKSAQLLCPDSSTDPSGLTCVHPGL